MRGPKPPTIDLADAERQELEHLVRRHTTPQQLALRARIVLAAADGANNCQIARQLHVSLDMVRRWRERWLVLQPASLDDLPLADRLTDAPRPGAPVHITAEQVAKIVALACETPDEIKNRGIVAQISGRHAARLLTRGAQTASDPLLADPTAPR